MIEVKNIIKSINDRGLKHNFVMEQLNISRGTFYSRIKDSKFKPEEVTILKRLGLV